MKKKRVIMMCLLILTVFIVGIIAAKCFLEFNLKKVAQSNVKEVQFSKLKDGVYTGNYKAFPVEAEVKVTIDKRRIKSIVLVTHKNGRGKGAEIIPGKVVENQSLKVDSVAGATYSSKVILKAIENAINKAEKE